MPANPPKLKLYTSLCIFVLLLTLSPVLTAQNFQSKSAKQVVYFETGSSDLDTDIYSLLDSLALVLLKKPVYKLSIEGHTDDVGNASYNKKLSQDRAQEVKQYLQGKGILSTIQTAHFGESNPSTSNQSDKGRASNRRVEIYFQYPIISSVEEIKSIIANKQKYVYRPQEVTHIEATHGTIIDIPKQAFVFADGSKPTGPVEINVIESLTNASHVLNDLSTLSNGQILETGGMIYISASSEGKELELGQKKSIQINIPSNDVRKGMQLFYGQEKGEDENVNWVLDKKQTVNKKERFRYQLSEEEKKAFLYSLDTIMIPEKQQPQDPDFDLLYQLIEPPKEPSKPYQPKKPIYPKLVDVSSKKSKKGAKKKFTKNDIKNHQFRLERYEKRYAKYQKDSTIYESKLLIYGQQQQQYDKDYKDWETSTNKIKNVFINYYKEYEEYLDINRANQGRINLQKMIRKDQVNTQHILKQLHQRININEKREALTKVQHKVYEFSKKHPELFLKGINNIYGYRQGCDPVFFPSPYMQKVDQVGKDIQNTYRERKIQSGDFSTEDINSYFTSINQLGWINIDRFMKMEGRKELLVKAKSNSKNYLVFKEINSILPINKNANSKALNSVTCPPSYEATIVSISVDEEGQVLFASKSVNTSTEQVQDMDYKVCSIKDIQKALDIMN